MIEEIRSIRNNFQSIYNNGGFGLYAFFAFDRQRTLLKDTERILRRTSMNEADAGEWEFIAKVYALNAMYDEAESIHQKYATPRNGILSATEAGREILMDCLFQLSSHCNLSCIYCPRENRRDSRSYMDPLLFSEILKQLIENNIIVRQITLNQSGESLLHPDFFNILENARKIIAEFPIRPNVLLFTNGHNVDHRCAKQLIDMGVINTFIWSIDGVDKFSYERIRKGGDYHTVLAYLEHFLKIKPPEIKVIIYNMIDRHCELSAFDPKLNTLFEKAEKVAVRFPSSRYGMDYGYYAYGRFRNRGCCYWGRNQMVIDSQGRMRLCSIDLNGDTAFADLNHTSFSEAYFKIRRAVLQQMDKGRHKSNFELCCHCPMTDNTYEPTFGTPIGPASLSFYEKNKAYLSRFLH